MNKIEIGKVKLGDRLGENVYRHDGMLAIPKGQMIKKRELDELHYLEWEYIEIANRKEILREREGLEFALNLIIETYRKAPIWNEEYGEDLGERIVHIIEKDNKLSKYLMGLSNLEDQSLAHLLNVSIVVSSMVMEGDEDKDGLANLSVFSLFHDVGRLEMPEVFKKEGKLNNREFKKLKKHPIISYKMLKRAGFNQYDLKFVQETHENVNGSGYPEGLSQGEIEDFAQIVSIADMYNALSSYRSYREMYNSYEVMKIIESEKGKKFEERFVELFKRKFSPYREGMIVELNNGRMARVSSVKPKRPILPVVEVVDDVTGEAIRKYDLGLQKKVRIKKIVG